MQVFKRQRFFSLLCETSLPLLKSRRNQR